MTISMVHAARILEEILDTNYELENSTIDTHQ